jgi:RNA-binding protein 39
MAIALSGQPLLGQPVMVKPSEAEKNLVQTAPAVPNMASFAGITNPLLLGALGATRRLLVENLHPSMSEVELRQVFPLHFSLLFYLSP